MILACDLVVQNGWRELRPADPRVIELSSLLQRMPLHPPAVRGLKFRNPNGVARKTVDLVTSHPGYDGKRTKGGKIDREVLHDFLTRPEEMQAVAREIRAGIEDGSFERLPETLDADSGDAVEASEGRLLARRYFARERNPRLREKKINAFVKQHGRVFCEVCGFDFEATYGTRGASYIECHHAVPLHMSGETTTRLRDLVLLCANCHRMIHRGSTWLTPAELLAIVRTE
ncbi:5-methylcytosine-specific restriction protein A [Prauserella shujinwangii]|uniref:5-methylcytosine-specific restriction protein A n=1 Tax=Prauserella shujinwangii TaxID=1453103 RepID=A0A2T0LPT1_9PSEU|nr:5-methylcytosine-specific restriction protein A [Prauserella shujinwangii]